MSSGTPTSTVRIERREIVVRGIVQGVGFRPFVHQLAAGLGLRGFVRNQSGALHIEVEGGPDAIDAFVDRLTRRPPPLAKIDDLRSTALAPDGASGFAIHASESTESEAVFISPDVATCDQCLSEMADPADRRFGYPFINCTNCGPRLTIITGSPYDRPWTTMAAFEMCPACRAEYEDPADRRFHAQPIACPACGPRLSLLDESGRAIPTARPLERFAAALLAGAVGAVKGLGGFHLACDARDEGAVASLRRRKHREDKPFAVMAADLDAAAALCRFDHAERDLLRSPRRPIVLLDRRGDPPAPVAPSVAPAGPQLGLMLPYTPIHHLLLEAVGRAPLVMTSGNRSDEPIARDNGEAVRRLNGIADVYLVHDRPIHVRCDDSVTRIVDAVEQPARRSRGYAPQPLDLPLACPVPMLAVGGQLKNTFALGRDRHAFLSHHMGDLDDLEARRAFERDIALYQGLFGVTPRLIAHDLHPDYASTGYARQRAARDGVELLAVQHHHAHLASCMADNRLDGRVIGVVFDGAGLGDDGAAWGGEVLVGGYERFARAARLRYVAMPGGEAAIRQPWRMALAHLRDAGCPASPLDARLPPRTLATVARMLERGVNAPMTSSAGRLFDAVAALLGLRDTANYEGQAAVELEWLAQRGPDPARLDAYPFGLDAPHDDGPIVIDTRPTVRAIARQSAADPAASPRIAARFHLTLACMVEAVCLDLRARTGLDRVVLSGGVFMNRTLTSLLIGRLGARDFAVHIHRRVPPNDGGLSLGQLAIAASNCGDS